VEFLDSLLIDECISISGIHNYYNCPFMNRNILELYAELSQKIMS